MTINERVRELRKELGLTQIEFGNRISMSQGHLTSVETGSRAVTDKLIKLLNLEFNASEEWLRTGNGEMFEDHGDSIAAFAAEIGLNEFQENLVRIVASLPDAYQDMILELAHKIAGDSPVETEYERTTRIALDAIDKYDREQAESEQEA